MPFKEGPRRAEKDQDGNPTYTCTWEGEFMFLSPVRTAGESRDLCFHCGCLSAEGCPLGFLDVGIASEMDPWIDHDQHPYAILMDCRVRQDVWDCSTYQKT